MILPQPIQLEMFKPLSVIYNPSHLYNRLQINSRIVCRRHLRPDQQRWNMAMPDEATGDGFDTQMQTNHLSTSFSRVNYFHCWKRVPTNMGKRMVNHSVWQKKCPQTRCQIPGTEWWQLGRRWLCAKRRRSMGSLWANQACKRRIYRCFARQTPSKSIEGQIIGRTSRMGKHRAASQH